MDAELKAKWVRALRSGKYKQGTWALRSRRGHYCCLGVLCKVAGIGLSRDGITVAKKYGFDRYGYGPILDLIGGEDVKAELTSRNDRGKPFSEIADYIEREL